MQCANVMSRKPYFLATQQPVAEAAERMRALNRSFLPVCDAQGRVVGGVADRDIVERLVADGRSGQTPVAEVMNRRVFFCRAEDEAQQVKALLQEHGVDRLVCLDGDDRLVGMVTLADVTSPQNFVVAPADRERSSFAGH